MTGIINTSRSQIANITSEIILWNDTSLGMTAKIQRICCKQTRQDIANIAGVSLRDVKLLESNKPLRCDIIRRLLRAYRLIIESELEKDQFQFN